MYRLTVFTLLVGFLVVASGLLRVKRRFFSEELVVTFFDVGQGDAALLQTPRGKTVLIDAGGGFGEWNAGERVLVPELTRLGVLTVDVALLSHPDQDHGYGFLGIFEHLQVGELWVHGRLGQLERKPLFRYIKKLARFDYSRIQSFGQRTAVPLDGAWLHVFPIVAGGTTNDRGLALVVEFKDCRLLFAADLERSGEKALARQASDLWPVSLLKVAHHGSRTSSSSLLLKRARPRWAVVSVGAGNRYGHPHAKAIGRLQGEGAQILRTDFHGYLKFYFSPKGVARCESAQGSCGTSACASGLPVGAASIR